MASLKEAGLLLAGARRGWTRTGARPSTLLTAPSSRANRSWARPGHHQPLSAPSSAHPSESADDHAPFTPTHHHTPYTASQRKRPFVPPAQRRPLLPVRPPSVTHTPSTVLSTPESIAFLVDTIRALQPNYRPALYMGIQGERLSRDAHVSLAVLYLEPENHVFLIDVHTLQSTAFDTPGADGSTLRTVLEDPHTPKAFFDVRSSAAALHARFGVDLRGVHDLQLMENNTRPKGYRRYVSGLGACIQRAPEEWNAEKRVWKGVGERGRAVFGPSEGGSHAAFRNRPLHGDLERYCVSTVAFLPALWQVYWARLVRPRRDEVLEESAKRVVAAQGRDYDDNTDYTLGPWE